MLTYSETPIVFDLYNQKCGFVVDWWWFSGCFRLLPFCLPYLADSWHTIPTREWILHTYTASLQPHSSHIGCIAAFRTFRHQTCSNSSNAAWFIGRIGLHPQGCSWLLVITGHENWLFLWDWSYILFLWGFLTGYNWYFYVFLAIAATGTFRWGILELSRIQLMEVNVPYFWPYFGGISSISPEMPEK